MSDEKNMIEKIGKGKLILAACLAVFFIFQPDVFHFVLVAALLLFPVYYIVARWLDRQ